MSFATQQQKQKAKMTTNLGSSSSFMNFGKKEDDAKLVIVSF
jgi:hypothetical protein